MPEKAHHLADKLLSEGERTLTFFRSLPEDTWSRQVYADGAQWTVRDMLEHLIQSEQTLLALFAQIANGGAGASTEFDIERYNREHTGRLAALSQHALFDRYATSRQATSDFARALSDEQLALRGRHPAMGDSSVEDMLKLVYLHNSLHAKDTKKALAGA